MSTFKQIYKQTSKLLKSNSKSKFTKKETTNLMNEALKYYEQAMVDSMNKSIYFDSWLNIKPLKYYVKPIISFKIPYPYIDLDYESDRKGLFIGWYEVNIGKRKFKNENYKEEMKKYRENKKTVYFVKDSNFQWKTPKI